MFENLSERLNNVFKRLKGYGKLTEEHVNEGLREVRLALLEADVNFKVVKEFINRIKERAVGQEVMESLTPGQQVIKIVHEELIKLLGGYQTSLNLAGKQPVVIILAGLQGSGKTTTCAKLALFLRKKGRKPYLVSVDIYRPNAIDQLKTLGKSLGIDVFPSETSLKPAEMLRSAINKAMVNDFDTIIVDTAGRLQIDENLMQELKDLKEIAEPQEVLLVVDSMTGQEAVNIAKKFDETIGITGFVLSKMEGDSRGGAALSIQYVTEKPIKFVGVGEKADALEQFYPERIANRILQMGDVLTLIEKAQANLDPEKALELQEKLKKDEFSLGDFKEHLIQIRKLGSMEQIISMIPGFNKIKQVKDMLPKEKDLTQIVAIIDSMTLLERRQHAIINASRKKRIATGSGTTVQDVNKLLKNYTEMERMMKKMKQGKMKGMKNIGNLAKGMFGNLQ